MPDETLISSHLRLFNSLMMIDDSKEGCCKATGIDLEKRSLLMKNLLSKLNPKDNLKTFR